MHIFKNKILIILSNSKKFEKLHQLQNQYWISETKILINILNYNLINEKYKWIKLVNQFINHNVIRILVTSFMNQLHIDLIYFQLIPICIWLYFTCEIKLFNQKI